MNIEQAKTVPLSVIMDKMGQVPQRTTEHKTKFFSPYRNEDTPSFYIYPKENRWFDYGDNRGGDTIDLVRAYLETSGLRSDVTAALRWIRNMTDWQKITPVNDHDCYENNCEGEATTLVFKKAEPIKKMALIRYGEKRGIAASVLKQYVEQVYFLNKETGRSVFALGMRNESKGYDLRNPYFKGCLRKKDVSVIRGSKATQTAVNIFEGMMDFLTVVTQRNGKPLEDDSIILHSLACMEKGSSYVRNHIYQHCYTWFDNDLPGQKATKSWAEFCTHEGLQHLAMNKEYEPYKDVNAAHMAKLELS